MYKSSQPSPLYEMTPKSAKKGILAQKCEITDFGQIVHNYNAILLQ